jgi:hypothetical protein
LRTTAFEVGSGMAAHCWYELDMALLLDIVAYSTGSGPATLQVRGTQSTRYQMESMERSIACMTVICDFRVRVGVGVKPGTEAKLLEMVTVMRNCVSKKGSTMAANYMPSSPSDRNKSSIAKAK